VVRIVGFIGVAFLIYENKGLPNIGRMEVKRDGTRTKD
jgi:hypothetical protein